MDNSKRFGRITSSQMHKVCCAASVAKYNYYDDYKDFELGEKPIKSFTKKLDAESYKAQKNHVGVVIYVPSKPNKPFYTYLDEVVIERLVNRTIDTDIKTRPILWGSLMEVYLLSKLGLGWKLVHKDTILHPVYGHIWSGTPDLIAKLICAENKSYQIKNFVLFSICLNKGDVELVKKEFPKEYWQVISNCALTGKKKAMLISFMPSLEDLKELFHLIDNTDYCLQNNLNKPDYYFMREENLDSLPYLTEKSKINSLNTFTFDVPEEDIKFMEQRVRLFDKELNKKLTKKI